MSSKYKTHDVQKPTLHYIAVKTCFREMKAKIVLFFAEIALNRKDSVFTLFTFQGDFPT